MNFDEAKAAPLAEVHAGDQLRARGDKNADGTELTAVEIVSGSFRIFREKFPRWMRAKHYYGERPDHQEKRDREI